MTLELKGVEKRVGAETHIYPTSVSLADGEFNILLGTTLAGKTTLIQLMAGLDKPSEGEVWLKGRNVTHVSAPKRNVSMVHQQFINYPNMTVFDNIASPLRVARMPANQIADRVHRAADLLRLTPMLNRRPSELSGGQQQRTALARSLVKDSDIVLLDEPLANLDFKLREELRDELPRLFEDRNCTVVYATTEPTEALLLGGHTLALHEGRMTQFGETGRVYRQPQNLATAKVFSDPPINTAPIVKHGDRAELGDAGLSWVIQGPLADRPDGPYIVGIRPHFVTPVASTPEAAKIEGEILVAELSGSESIVHFKLHGHPWVSQSHGVHPFKVGETTTLFIDTRHCLYFDEQENLVGD